MLDCRRGLGFVFWSIMMLRLLVLSLLPELFEFEKFFVIGFTRVVRDLRRFTQSFLLRSSLMG
jgi:hypothetical protein